MYDTHPSAWDVKKLTQTEMTSTYYYFSHSMTWKPGSPLHPCYLTPKSVRRGISDLTCQINTSLI